MGALAHLMENISDPALAAKLISEVKVPVSLHAIKARSPLLLTSMPSAHPH